MAFARLVAGPLNGLMRVLRGDRTGVDWMGAGSDAGWIASFLVPGFLLAPVYGWMVLRRLGDVGSEPDFGPAFAIEAIGYVIGWTAFPVLSHAICERIGKPVEWYGYVVAYNWANVLQIAFYLPAALLGTFEGVPPMPLFLIGVISVSAAIAIHFRVARVVLGIDAVPALMLVAVDLAVGQIVARIVDRLHGI
ncbi:MAG: hypothetical protein JNL71_07575 [Rhodospirillales bacterium]|nr:hypothetical protein [Rhodospirillales bacterium]